MTPDTRVAGVVSDLQAADLSCLVMRGHAVRISHQVVTGTTPLS